MARRLGVAVVMLLVVGVLVWAGVKNFRARKAAMEQARAQHITLTKDGSGGTMKMSDDAPDPLGKDLRGKEAPAFTLPTVDGKKISLAQYKGHPVVLNFWATYCGPCKLEMPWFEEFTHKYSAQGLVVLGIDDEDGVTKEDVAHAAKKVGVTYPILIDDSKNASAYGLGDYLPVTYYVDAQGIVRAQTPGAPSKDEVEANIHKILGAAQ